MILRTMIGVARLETAPAGKGGWEHKERRFLIHASALPAEPPLFIFYLFPSSVLLSQLEGICKYLKRTVSCIDSFTTSSLSSFHDDTDIHSPDRITPCG